MRRRRGTWSSVGSRLVLLCDVDVKRGYSGSRSDGMGWDGM